MALFEMTGAPRSFAVAATKMRSPSFQSDVTIAPGP
jgi:hypothetical protein